MLIEQREKWTFDAGPTKPQSETDGDLRHRGNTSELPKLD